MRIDYLSSVVVPSYRADGIQVMRMCEAFARLGHQVTLWARPGDQPEEPFAFYGVEPLFELALVKRPELRLGLGDRLYARRIAGKLRERPRADLYYGRHAPALASAAGSGIPCMLEVHHPPQDALYGRSERRILRHPDFSRLVTISQALADEYTRTHSWLRPAKVLVAPDAASGEDKERLTPRQASAAFSVGYIGSLLPGRGIELIGHVARALPDCTFHIVGGSIQELAHWIEKAGELPNVDFHERITPAMVPLVSAPWDVLVAPYQQRVHIEGGRDTARWMSPLKIFEYMAAGKAIVASDLPALREVLTHRETALLVAPHDVAGWAAALRALRDDPALRERLGARAQEVWRERFTWERRAQTVLAGL